MLASWDWHQEIPLISVPLHAHLSIVQAVKKVDIPVMYPRQTFKRNCAARFFTNNAHGDSLTETNKMLDHLQLLLSFSPSFVLAHPPSHLSILHKVQPALTRLLRRDKNIPKIQSPCLMLLRRFHTKFAKDDSKHIHQFGLCEIGARTSASTIAKGRPIEIHPIRRFEPAFRLESFRVGEHGRNATLIVGCCGSNDSGWDLRCFC